MSDAAPQSAETRTEGDEQALSPQEALELLQDQKPRDPEMARDTRPSPVVMPIPAAEAEPGPEAADPPSPVMAEASEPALRQERPRPPGALASLLAFLGQLAIAAALVFLAISDRKQPTIELRPPPSSEPAPNRIPFGPQEAGGALVPFGADGKALYADGQGRFLLLAPAPDGKLRVERALDLVVDPSRFHNNDRRREHAYYLEDLGAARRAYLTRLRSELEVLVRRQRLEDMPQIEDLCERLADFHDVATLEVYLRNERFVVRRAAAVALGEAGYLMAVPELIFSLNTRDAAFRSRLNTILEDLTGQRFITDPEPRDQDEAMNRARAWFKENPAPSKYALGLKQRRALERRLKRGLAVGE